MMVKDCMQESLIQIIRKIDLYEERGKFKSWVSTVTVKKCLDILRKEKRHLSSDMEIVSEPFINESVSHSLNAQDVMRFLDTLPDQYRIAINMFLVEGYSHKEIGKKLQISESSSRSLVSRGRKMIMKSFNLDDDKSESDAMYKAPLSGFKKKMVSFE
jgi:RNA polymerase sigma-70 factor (ECF subfamily)